MTTPSTEERVNVMVVNGVAGTVLYIRDHRVAGEKPWGGGTVICEFEMSLADLGSALPDGWVLARRQDAEDGAALRELREALGDWWLTLTLPYGGPPRVLAEPPVTMPPPARYPSGTGPTIAAAARKAREALP